MREILKARRQSYNNVKHWCTGQRATSLKEVGRRRDPTGLVPVTRWPVHQASWKGVSIPEPLLPSGSPLCRIRTFVDPFWGLPVVEPWWRSILEPIPFAAASVLRRVNRPVAFRCVGSTGTTRILADDRGSPVLGYSPVAADRAHSRSDLPVWPGRHRGSRRIWQRRGRGLHCRCLATSAWKTTTGRIRTADPHRWQHTRTRETTWLS